MQIGDILGVMSRLKQIRQHLGVTQKVIGDALGCVQGSIVAYEAGRSLPQKRAQRLIEFAAEQGCKLDFNHIYGERPLPKWVAMDEEGHRAPAEA